MSRRYSRVSDGAIAAGALHLFAKGNAPGRATRAKVELRTVTLELIIHSSRAEGDVLDAACLATV